MTAPLPDNEEARLHALAQYEVFDTGSEPAFDRVTSLAARLFKVPISLISLVGRDRQWLKSHHGIDACETSRDVSFCAHAILLPPEAGAFVVPDAAQDSRFINNPLVTGPLGIRFYAGAPLRTPAGLTIGSLCLLDTRPRDFSEDDRAVLADLAASVMETLELRLVTLRHEHESAERRLVESALRQSESRFRRMAASTPGMVYQFVRSPDGSFHFPFVSEGCREIFNLGPQDVYDRPECVIEAFEESERASLHASIDLSAKTLAPWHWEGCLRDSTGTVRWIEGMSKPERLAAGKILWSGVLFDITERKRVQIELENSHSLLRAIIDGTDNQIFIKNRESRYLLINPSGAAMLGITTEEVVGKDDSAFFPPESVVSNRATDQEIMRTGGSLTYESSDFINGIEHVFLSTKSPYKDASGELLGVIGIAREITDQRRAAEALRAAKEEAEKANHAKSEFLSRMSHELRTPLNAILGFGQLLEMGELERRESESVGHILKAGRYLLALIDEVLSLSRIEAGRMNLSLEPVSVAEIALECLSLVRQQAAARRVLCENRCGDMDLAGTCYVRADRQRLRQVLLNLLSNAVKYNCEGGRLTLSCRQVPGADGEPDAVRIEVSDTGVGLHAGEIARLFTPFERLSASKTAVEGTGLGLALSKGLVEAMNGRIGVDSIPGQGSTFWLCLPDAPDPLAGALRDKSALVAGGCGGEDCEGTVLYIEDNLSNLRLIEMLLEDRRGVTLLSAQQGTLGLEMARSARPDLILLDLHLPDIPGWEVLAALRADTVTRAIPTVVISADATRPQIERLMRAGARDYLTKPIDVPALVRVLSQHLKPAGAGNDGVSKLELQEYADLESQALPLPGGR